MQAKDLTCVIHRQRGRRDRRIGCYNPFQGHLISAVDGGKLVEYSPSLRRVVRFGVFEVDLQSGGLRKSELKIRMQERPFQVLTGLLSRNGSPYLYPMAEERPWRPL